MQSTASLELDQNGTMYGNVLVNQLAGLDENDNWTIDGTVVGNGAAELTIAATVHNILANNDDTLALQSATVKGNIVSNNGVFGGAIASSAIYGNVLVNGTSPGEDGVTSTWVIAGPQLNGDQQEIYGNLVLTNNQSEMLVFHNHIHQNFACYNNNPDPYTDLGPGLESTVDGRSSGQCATPNAPSAGAVAAAPQGRGRFGPVATPCIGGGRVNPIAAELTRARGATARRRQDNSSMRMAPAFLAVVVTVGAAGCGGGSTKSSTTSPSGGSRSGATIAVSSDFKAGATISRVHTCDGRDVSPPLHAGGLPASTKEVVVVMRDPDAPGGTFIHWGIANLEPASGSMSLSAGATPPGAVLGRNSFGSLGYRGPCPPSGPAHHYVITVYALGQASGLRKGFSADDVSGLPVLGQGTLTGVYAKQ